MRSQTTLDLKKISKAVASVLVDTSDGKTTAQGSGFFIDSTGRFVTNYHVIEDASSAIVKTSDGGFYEVDGTLAVDEEHDLAILKVAGSNFAYVSLGDSDTVRVGEKVYAVGSPLGLEATVSDGIVSSIRELDQDRLIQTTAPISHGSSGGPLLNLRGQVIGVTTLQMEGGQNLNFAIPSKLIRPLLASKKVTAFAPPRLSEAPTASEAKNVAPKAEDDFSDLPGAWTGTLNRSEYHVRVLGDHLYVKSTFMEDRELAFTDEKGLNWSLTLTNLSLNCDGKRQGDKWVGVCAQGFTIVGNFNTSCSLSLRFQVEAVSRQRIEGRLQDFGLTGILNFWLAPSTCPKTVEKDDQLILIPE